MELVLRTGLEQPAGDHQHPFPSLLFTQIFPCPSCWFFFSAGQLPFLFWSTRRRTPLWFCGFHATMPNASEGAEHPSAPAPHSWRMTLIGSDKVMPPPPHADLWLVEWRAQNPGCWRPPAALWQTAKCSPWRRAGWADNPEVVLSRPLSFGGLNYYTDPRVARKI